MALLVLTACSGKKDATNSASPAATNAPATTDASAGESAAPADGYPVLPRDPITLKVFTGGPDTNKGIFNTTIGKEIQKKFGITLDLITGDDVKAKTMIAGGDLPDVLLTVGISNLVDSMIQGGQVIAMDDLIEKYGPNIKKNAGKSLEIMKKSASNGTDKVYFLPVRTNKSNTNNISKVGLAGFYTRWDLYKDLGAPVMANEDDFLKMNKAMQDKNPTTKDGKKTYAFSAWAADLFPYIISYPFSMGYNNWTADTSVSAADGSVQDNFIQTDGVFWNGIKFFNKAYRMGMFDPEGFTQKLDQYEAKLNSGQVFNSAASFWMGGNELIKNTGHDNAQLLMLPGPFTGYMALYPKDAPGGNLLGPARAITKANKYPERTMELFNYLSGDEGGRLLFTGVKGVDWDVVDGVPTLIGEMAKPTDPGYDAYLKSVGNERLNKLSSLHEAWEAEDGYPLDLKLVVNPATVSKAEKELAVQFGADLHPGQVYDKLVKEGKAVADNKYFAYMDFVKQLSEGSAQVMTKAEQYFLANTAKFIMAKDDAAFEAAKKKAIDDFNAMGVDKAYAELHKLIEDAKVFAATIK
ncbi:unnamed protein product [Aphanomyces euteiches]